jgi:hypothetical protein
VANVEGVVLETRGPVRRGVRNTAKAVRCAIDWALMKQSELGEDVSNLFEEPTLVSLDMHDYQEAFLAEKVARYGLADRAAPLRCLLNFAAGQSPFLW